ncbi:MAG: PA14 domain-containing protein [Anaerolineaceae bacterium]|nr:PA14 domain-containing protein [Anaerolineaceae bacterium]
MKRPGRLKQSRVFDYAVLVCALYLGIASTFILRQPEIIASDSIWPWLSLLAAALLGGYALLRIDAWLPEGSTLPKTATVGAIIRRRQAWACMVAAGLFTAWVVFKLWPDYHRWDGTLFPWFTALALLLLGGFLFGVPEHKIKQTSSLSESNDSQPRADFLIPRWVEVGGFLFIAALAIFLRVYRIDIIPAGIYVDETNGAMDALAILQGNHASPFATGWYGTPNGYIYYMAMMIRFFGANYGTLKAISLIPAILTVFAIYPLGRMMFGPIGGLSAMLLLAVSRWHLSMSRWGWNETAVPLFQILAIYFLLRGLRERRPRDFVVGGIISGLMMYTYLSSRLAIATIALFIVYWIIFDPAGPVECLKRNRLGLALFAIAGIIAFAPLAVTHITDPFTFSNRVDEISIFRDIKEAGSLQPLWANIQDQLRFFHQIGDHQGKHNLPNEPETDPFTGVLFVIGLAYGSFRLRDRRWGLLWLWLLFGLVGGVFSSHHESPQSYRTLTALPAITLLAGGVLSRILRGGYRVFPKITLQIDHRRSRTFFIILSSGLFTIALVGSTLWESTTYFVRQANAIEYQAGFNLTENGVAHDVVNALINGSPVFVSPRFYDFSQLRYLVYGYMKQTVGRNTLDDRPYFLIRPEDALPIPSQGKDTIFLLDTYYQPVMDLFRLYYPDVELTVVKWSGQLPLYIRARVPVADFAAIQGVNYKISYPNGQVKTGTLPTITSPENSSEASKIEWDGSIQVEHSGNYRFSSLGDLQILIDGKPLVDTQTLCGGLHRIHIIQDNPSIHDPAEVFWTAPGKEGAPIPTQNLFIISPPKVGLTGYYYQGAEWQGEPVCVRETPFFLLAWPDQEPLANPFSAKYKGFLRVTQPGSYRLVIHADDGARLTLDDKIIGEGLKPNQPNDFEVKLDLDSGDHPIQIDYFQLGGGSGLTFNWQPPDGPETVVPMEALLPENP